MGRVCKRSGLLENILHDLPRIIPVRRWILNSQARLLTTSKQISWFSLGIEVGIIRIIVIMAVTSMRSSGWVLI